MLLSTTCCIEVVSQEADVYWRAQALRQQVSGDYVAMRRTARQWCHELAAYKRMIEESQGVTLSAKEVAVAFVEQGRLVKDSNEEFTPNFVLSALAVHEAICMDTQIVACMESLEARFGLQSCLNSITKLQEVIRKAVLPEERKWFFAGLMDLIDDKKIRNEDVSKAVLTGGTHSAGLVQLLLLKRKLLFAFLNIECPKAGFDHQDMELIRNAMGSYESYRSSVSGRIGQPEPVMSWLGRLRESSLKVLRLLEA